MNGVNFLLAFTPDPDRLFSTLRDNVLWDERMHARKTASILEPGTGIAIVSLGETRTLRFKNIKAPSEQVDFQLPAGSLIYMTQEVQDEWLHAIPASDTDNGRMSLTFRAIR